jgi:hypothetical protein
VPVGIGEVTRGKVTVTRGISDTSVGISEKTVARSETFISKREACGAVRVSYSDNFEIIRARTEQTISRSASIVARFKHDFLVIGYDQKVMLGAAGDRLSNVSHRELSTGMFSSGWSTACLIETQPDRQFGDPGNPKPKTITTNDREDRKENDNMLKTTRCSRKCRHSPPIS